MIFSSLNVFAIGDISDKKSFLDNIVEGPGPTGTCPDGQSYCSDKYDLTKSYIFLDSKHEKWSENIIIVSGGGSSDEFHATFNGHNYDIIWLYRTKNGFLYVPQNVLKTDINDYISFNQKSNLFTIQYESVDNDTDYVKPNDKILILDGEEIIKSFSIDYEVPVESISIVSDKNIYDLRYDEDEFYLGYEINPDNNSYCGDLQWTSSNPEIAEVSDEGHVFIMGRGVTNITVTTDEGISDTFLLTIKDPRVNGVSIESYDFYKDLSDDDFYLDLIIDCDDDPEYKVQYNSQKYLNTLNYSDTFNSNELDIDSSGKVHLKKPGTIDLGVRVYDVYYKNYYYCYEINIHITAKMTGIDVPNNIVLNVNDPSSQDYSYNVDFVPSNTTDVKEYTLSSSDSSIVDVDNENKKLIAKKRGIATITATTETGFNDSTIVKVIDPRIFINCEEKYILDINDEPVLFNPVIEKQDFTGFPTTEYKNWSGSDSSAFISYDYIKPRGIGITDYSIKVYYPTSLKYFGGEAKYYNGKYYVEKHFLIEILSKITDFSIKDESVNLHPGESESLEYNLLPNNTTDDKTITWTSSDESVAIVEDDMIVAINPGTTFITGTTVNGLSDSIEVTVKNRIDVSNITFKALAKKVYTGKQIKQDIYATYNGVRLKQNIDYKLSFGKNITTGKGAIKATFIGDYIGSKTLYFYILPVKVPIRTPKSPSKGTAVVYYNKTPKTSGYQVAYKIKGAKKWTQVYSSGSSKKLTKLKSGKYYYFVVRAYKQIDNKKVFGAWSNKKYVKVK